MRADKAPAAKTAMPVVSALWPYSKTYAEIAEEGGQRPPPSFGAPALVWHLGIWPTLVGGELDPKLHGVKIKLGERIETYEKHNERFFQELSDLLVLLQERGRVADSGIIELKLLEPRLAAHRLHEANVIERQHAFRVCEPQSVTFTLWWQDAAGKGGVNQRQLNPMVSDLRVRVQVQTHLDHATISFFIDAGKPWNASRLFGRGHAPGDRRSAIFEHATRINQICSRQIRDGRVDADKLPERGIAESEARELLGAADYCYDQIWQEFAAAFGLGAIVGTSENASSRVGEVFADFRGLVLAVDGISTPREDERLVQTRALRQRAGMPADEPDKPGWSASIGAGRFAAFDGDRGEPNTILKGYWPFVRRMLPGADDRDFVACGVFDWRALYVTAFGSRVQPFERDEAADPRAAVPSGSLPEARTGDQPIRQLFLTKGEPHRQQIGRIVERANALGTMRLYALRNWTTIRNAGVYVRLLGEQLDGVLSYWSRRRRQINIDYPPSGAAEDDIDLSSAEVSRYSALMNWLRGAAGQAVEPPREQRTNDARVEELTKLIAFTETRLIALSAELDNIGQGGSGRLLYVINRSRHFIDEFHRMLETLKITNIETWITYSQFADRGLAPTFEFIANTGDRLISLRSRLQTITEMVQTGALIVETEATQSNTKTLRKIASNWNATQLGLTGVVFGLFFQSALTLFPELHQDTGLKERGIGLAFFFLLLGLLYLSRNRRD